MFCAGCGSQIQPGLNYCSRCGRRAADDKLPKASQINPLTIVGQTAGVGFVAFIFILIVLAKYGTVPNIFVPITFFYFAALFGICFMILRHGSSSEKPEASPTPRVEEPSVQAYLRPVTTAQLEEAREMGVGSVTDATTRTLGEMKIERK